MRRPATLLIALLLVLVAAVPAEAKSVHRVFTANVGTDGKSGTVRITDYSDGTGRVDYALKRLHRGYTYRVEIHKGRCGNLGSIVKRIKSVKASSTGVYVGSKTLSIAAMNPIWQANWSHQLAIRFVSGGSMRCGNLTFVHATRVYIPKQGVLDAGINLPVVRGPSGYPYCNVAMYMGALSQPTESGATFIYAHARKGMFLPLLTQWRKNQGKNLIGMSVYVYTSNWRVNTYRITTVRKLKSVQSAVSVTSERLWLQTSTGPNFTYPKLVVIATRVSTALTTRAQAKPTPHIVHCG